MIMTHWIMLLHILSLSLSHTTTRTRSLSLSLNQTNTPTLSQSARQNFQHLLWVLYLLMHRCFVKGKNLSPTLSFAFSSTEKIRQLFLFPFLCPRNLIFGARCKFVHTDALGLRSERERLNASKCVVLLNEVGIPKQIYKPKNYSMPEGEPVR